MEKKMKKSLCVYDKSHPLEFIHEEHNYQHLLFWAFGEKQHTLYSVHEQSKVVHLETQDAGRVFKEVDSFFIERVILFMDDEVKACYWSIQLKNDIAGVPILLVAHRPLMADRVFHECGIRTVVKSKDREPLFIIRKHFREE
ncbi:hypothetical protein [Halobacillus sp. B29]|uniref:hypothetical protein n=1 Tax=Halobacillus sp. B29 TaxID=3457432 RepID=UPI003FCC4944